MGHYEELADELRICMTRAEELYDELERRGYTIGIRDMDNGEFPSIEDIWKEVTTRTDL